MRRWLARPSAATLVTGARRSLAGAASPEPEVAGRGSLRSALQYCKELVQRRDREGQVCLLAAPAAARAPLIVLRSFNIEIASVKDSVRSATSGFIRMNWWRDAVERAAANDPPQHPVAVALSALHQQRRISKELLHSIIEAREDDLELQQPATMAELDRYVEGASGSLHRLFLQVLDAEAAAASSDAQHAASHVGRAVGLVTLLQGTPFHVSRASLYIPHELTQATRVSLNRLFAGAATDEDKKGMQEAIYHVASAAFGHIEDARKLRSAVPPVLRPALVSAVGASSYLEALRRVDFDAFHPQLHRRGANVLPLQLAVLWRRFSKSF
jgi:NADH dehydrogenase [ubiquinone] 1 alpha subcomplex assembly factor 6